MDFHLSYGKKADLSKEEISHGMLSVATDAQELTFDLEGQRISIKDILFVSATPEELIEGKLYANTTDGVFWYLAGGQKKSFQGLTNEQIEMLKSTTNIRVSAEEPEQKTNVGDVWLVVEE